MNFFKITILLATLILIHTSYPNAAKKYTDGWNFSLPETSHHHTVEMFSKTSALRLIACATSIAGLILIEKSICPTESKDEHKKNNNQAKNCILPLTTGILLTGIGICSIIYDHKWLAYFITKKH